MFLNDHSNLIKSRDLDCVLEEVYSLPRFAKIRSMGVCISVFIDRMTTSETYGFCRATTSIERLYIDSDVVIILFDLSIKMLSDEDIKGLVCHLISGIDASYKGAGIPTIFTNKGYFQISLDVIQQYGKNLSMYKDIFDNEDAEENKHSGIKSWSKDRSDNAKRERTKGFFRK